jgi:hypothetical protein
MNRNRSWLFVTIGALGFLAGAWLAKAQGPGEPGIMIGPGPGPEGGAGMIFQRRVIGPQGPGEDVTFQYVASEGSFERQVVKGAPYSAEALTETTQTLADGNKITHQVKAITYRDTDGRTRREQSLPAIGPFAASGPPPLTIFVNDPVAGVNYVLDPQNKTARKMSWQRFQAGTPAGGAPPAPKTRPTTKALDAKTESLGDKMIEGVQAQGTRTTITIPAGDIGNEKPIQIVSERWYSPELQTVVMSSRSDPRMGQSSYRLTNINRTEPQKTLFEVPADYTIQEMRGPGGPGGAFGMRRKGGPGPRQ